MKAVSPIQEILLITSSTFSQKQFCELGSPESSRQLTPAEKLKEACWNGLVNELLPEIMQTSNGSEKIFLWQVEAGKSYLRLSLGTCFPVFKKEFSLDPHIFLNSRQMN